ncbi:uncharacterized protein LOC132934570 [Metopolophium dirhodum]|uniref:uncharacterized protein LOC132934570 n=1 Tax=Metopolophium dirhodum TaxID=44670 RepID=UPI00298F643A|nr:uncharacterized protein LOC132934570 [Metopolophium dirhodum]
MHTSPPSSTLPIMKILSPKSGPHICLECCFKCNNIFSVLESPLHIHWIRSIDKKNEFLKIEPSLCDDSCLCDLCWKDLEKTYKSIKSNNRKEETYSEKKYRLLERYTKKKVSKNQNQARRCSIHLCSRYYCQKMTVNECENIKNLFLTFEYCHLIFVQSTKQTTDFLKFPFRLCKVHRDMILVMLTCQICGDKLNASFNTDDWSMYEIWNLILIENHLPLILKPGMFICVTCKGHISKTIPGFPTIDLPRLQKYILKNKVICLKLYGKSQTNLYNIICKGSTYIASPIVFPSTKKENERVRSTKVKFSDPLITAYYNYEEEINKNDTKSITSTALSNVAQQNPYTPKLQLKGEGFDYFKLEKYFKTYDKSLQNVYQVDNVEIDENESEIIGSCQGISEHNGIENNQSKINSHPIIICSVAQDSMNLNEGNQCMNKINTIHKHVYLNETDNSMNSFIAEVEPPNAIVNPVSIKRKQSNLICHTISNKDVKKQKLNENNIFYEKNSTDDDSAKSYKNKNTDHSCINPQSSSNMTYNCKNKYSSNSDTSDSGKFSEVSSEEILTDSQKEDMKMDCKFVSDSEKSIDGKIILNDQNILEKYTTNLDSVKDSNFEMVLDAKSDSDSDGKSNINISVTEEFNKKLSTFKIVSNVQKGLDHEILLDGDKVFETASWSEKGTIKYKIIYDYEIKPSSNQGSTCIIISDNDKKFNNKVFSTYKINVQKGSDSQILLDGEMVKILSESENRKAIYEIDPSLNERSIYKTASWSEKGTIKYKNISDDEIKPLGNQGSTCIIIFDKSDCEMLLNCEKVYDIESDSENVKNFQKGSHSALMDGEKSSEMLPENENGRIKCMIASEIEEELHYKKVLDIKTTSNSKMLVNRV